MDFYKYQGELETYINDDPLKNKYTTLGDRSCMEGVFKAKWYKASDNRFYWLNCMKIGTIIGKLKINICT